MRSGMMRSVWVAVLICWSAGCGDDSAEGPRGLDAGGVFPTCQAAAEAVTVRLFSDPAMLALRACATDSDCTLSSVPRLTCASTSVSITDCPYPIAKAQLDAGVAFERAGEAALCSRIPATCTASPTCVDNAVRCMGGSCTAYRADAGQ